MRNWRGYVVTGVLALAACGGQPGEENTSDATADGTFLNQAEMMALTDFDTEATVPPAIAAAWSAVRVRVTDRDTGMEEFYEIPVGGAELLGNSGLVLSAGVFLPDFILDENGITSRSAEPINPAVRVIISEDGMADFEGWLFAKMPEIHPYPHTRYEVLLVEGIPVA